MNWRSVPLLWLFFAFGGRISRGIYWLCFVFLLCVNSVVVGQVIGGEEASFNGIAEAILPVMAVVTLFANIALSVKRLHDVGYGGFLALALLIPFINVAFTIWAGIIPGTAGPNAYGEAPDAPPP